MHHRYVIVLAACGGILVVALLVVLCVTPLGPLIEAGASTPELAVLRAHDPAAMQHFQVRLTQPVPGPYEAVSLLYTTDQGGQTLLHYALVERRRWGWYFAGGNRMTLEPARLHAGLDYDAGMIQGSAMNMYVVYGQMGVPNIVAVTVQLTTGQQLHSTVQNTYFLMLAPDVGSGPVDLCGPPRAFSSDGSSVPLPFTAPYPPPCGAQRSTRSVTDRSMKVHRTQRAIQSYSP